MSIPNPIVNFEGISQAAKTYDKQLRTLPLFALTEAISALGLNVLNVKDEDVITHMRRRGGGTKPYAVGKELKDEKDLLSFDESSLKLALTYFESNDNIQRYTEKKFDFQGGKPVDQISKNHPLEYWILKAIVDNHAEDVLFSALFFGERDDASDEASAGFDGFYTVMDNLILAEKIGASKGNYAETGEFNAPVNGDTDAYDALVEFIGGAHPMLRSSRGGNPILYVADNVLKNARAAFRNKVGSFAYPNMQQMIESLREDAMCPGLEVKTHISMGTGSRIFLTKPGNLDFGWNTSAASQFVDVRNPYRDPNVVQYWLQAAYGTRLVDWHEKVFRTNEQKNVGADYRGDIRSEESGSASGSASGSGRASGSASGSGE